MFLFIAPTVFSQSPKPSFDTIKDRIRSTTQTVALARIDSMTVTNQTLRSWLSVAKPTKFDQLAVDQIMALPGPDLAFVIRSLGFYDMSRIESLRDKDFITTGLAPALAKERDGALQSRLLEREINDKNPPMTEEQARRWYQENISQYTQPFAFSAHAIFLSTYRPYAIKKGDTLDKIARDEIGKPKAINRILDSGTSVPIFPSSDPRAIDFLFGEPVSPPPSLEMLRFMPPPKPQEGRIVWIPMADKERAAVRLRMEKIVEQLQSGADFVALARANSEETSGMRGFLIGPLPSPGRPLLDSVLDAAVKTSATQVTPIIETPNGFLLLQIVDKTQQTVRPYEEVGAQLIADELQKRRAKAATDLARSLFSDPVLQINREAIMTDRAPDSLVIARVDDFAYTWGDYRRDTGRRYSAPQTYDARVELLQKSVRLRDKIASAKAVAMGFDRDPDVVAHLGALEMIYRGRAYVEWYAQHRVPIDEGKLRQLYTDERLQFREPGQYQLRELIMKLDSDESSDPTKVASMTSFLSDVVAKRIKSERNFAQEAGSNANWPVRERQRGELKTVEEGYRGAQFADVLAGLEPGRLAGPFQVGDEVFLLWLRDRSKRRYHDFAEVKGQVKQLYHQLHWDELLGTAEKEIRARHQLGFLFTYPEGSETDSATKTAPARSP
jgi:parvulin-like peptidyl-prolyl isomerase